jgi:hypothetical protein
VAKDGDPQIVLGWGLVRRKTRHVISGRGGWLETGS